MKTEQELTPEEVEEIRVLLLDRLVPTLTDEQCEYLLSLLTKQDEQKPAKDSPEGLFGKYVISRSDGSPIHPENEYFVLKLKGDGDPIHMEACTKAVLTYAEEIRNHLPVLANDLLKRYGPFVKLEHPQANDADAKEIAIGILCGSDFFDCHKEDLQLNVTLNPDVKSRIIPAMKAFHEAMSREDRTELQYLKQANAELVEALMETNALVRFLQREHADYLHGNQRLSQNEQLLSKHDKS